MQPSSTALRRWKNWSPVTYVKSCSDASAFCLVAARIREMSMSTCRRTCASGRTQRNETTNTPSIRAKTSTPFGESDCRDHAQSRVRRAHILFDFFQPLVTPLLCIFALPNNCSCGSAPRANAAPRTGWFWPSSKKIVPLRRPAKSSRVLRLPSIQ